MNLRENVFTYSEIYENDEKKDMQTKKDTKIMRVRALPCFLYYFFNYHWLYLSGESESGKERET